MLSRSCLFIGLASLLLLGAGFYGIARWVYQSLENAGSGWESTLLRWEESLGEPLWEDIQRSHPPITNERSTLALDRLLYRLCAPNGVDTAGLHRHLIQNSEVNAFALPGRRLVVQSGLLQSAHGPDEVAGVLAHELAHAELSHVRQKIIKEAGLSLLMTWIGAGLGLGQFGIHDLARMLTSTAFDRQLESQADRQAVEYLQKAGINPEAFAVFMDRLAAKEKGNPAPPVWLSTHPASPERASQIRQLAQKNQEHRSYRPSLSASDWAALKYSPNP